MTFRDPEYAMRMIPDDVDDRHFLYDVDEEEKNTTAAARGRFWGKIHGISPTMTCWSSGCLRFA